MNRWNQLGWMLMAGCVATGTSVLAQSQAASSGGVLGVYNNVVSMGKVGLVTGLSRVLEVGKAIGPSHASVPFVDIELSTQVDPSTDFYAVIGLHEHQGKSEIGIENLYLQRSGLIDGLRVRAGRQFVPFGYMSQLHTELMPFASVPAAIEYFLSGGNLVADGISATYTVPVPFMLTAQVASWTKAMPETPEGFTVTNRMSQYRVLAGTSLTGDIDFSTSVHWLNGDGVSFKTQTDRVELMGTDMKMDWVLGQDHQLTILGEAMVMDRTLGATAFKRYGGYVAAWLKDGIFDYGVRTDWAESPDETLSRHESISALFNIRYTPGAVIKLQYLHDTTPAANHQVGIGYVVAMGSHNHPVIR